MQTPILLATTNAGKVSELKNLLREQNIHNQIQLLTLEDFPSLPAVEENGETFFENALIKAQAYFAYTQIPVLSDDSGLVVQALGGEPGVYSARYAGESADFQQNIQKLLNKMSGISDRRAFFVCNLIFLQDPFFYIVSEAHCHGEIALTPKGNGGFGYDPVFYLPETKKTMAEITSSQKQEISHRALAFRKMLPIFRTFFYANL